MRNRNSPRAALAKKYIALCLAAIVLTACSDAPPVSDADLAKALSSVGAVGVPCENSYGGDNTSGPCFEVSADDALPDVADALREALVSEGLIAGSDDIRCLKLTHLAPSVMGNCAFRLDGQLQEAGFDEAFVSVEFTREQLAELADGVDAYPAEYQVVVKIQRAGTTNQPEVVSPSSP